MDMSDIAFQVIHMAYMGIMPLALGWWLTSHWRKAICPHCGEHKLAGKAANLIDAQRTEGLHDDYRAISQNTGR